MRPTGSRRPVAIALAALALGVAATMATATATLAAGPVFGTPTVEGSLGNGITIEQPVTLDAVPKRVELLLTYADATGPEVIEVPPPTATGRTTLRYAVAEGDGHIMPNTRVQARWRITPSGGEPVSGPVATDVYEDARFDWQTVSGDVVRVHWYEGSKAFGQRALKIGEEAIAETSKLLGVSETEPVDFFIYADQQAFYDALGPATRENVGGMAVASIRTLFAHIAPGGIDDSWVSVVVPHELTHLVFDTAVENPYHFPPRWLNEGLADYLAQGYDGTYRNVVERAARDDTLIPLAGLVGQFPTSGDRFLQAYAESVSAVDYFIRTYGQDALVALIRSYADGRTDDEAFTAAIGMDVEAFDRAWLADLGAKMPVELGPAAAPQGPAPPGWEAPAGQGGTASSAPGTAVSPAPGGAVVSPVPSPGPAESGGPGSAPLVALLAVVVVAVVAIAVWRRSRQSVGGPTS